MKKFLAAALAAATLGTGFASPASAGPEDGEGCVGFPDIPGAYVCVISVTPTNVLPSTTTTNIPVTVPEFCYAIDCIGPTTVNVPVPGVQPGSGVVATLWYDGRYIPIGVGQVPPLPGLGGIDPVSLASEVLWIPILAVFGTEDAWYEFWCGAQDVFC